jgi:hypothetical protein
MLAEQFFYRTETIERSWNQGVQFLQTHRTINDRTEILPSRISYKHEHIYGTRYKTGNSFYANRMYIDTNICTSLELRM